VVIGIASSGLHTNGYSLGRKIFFEQLKLKPTSRLPGLESTIGDELLKVQNISYGRWCKSDQAIKFNIQHPTSNIQSRPLRISPAAVSWTIFRACCRKI